MFRKRRLHNVPTSGAKKHRRVPEHEERPDEEDPEAGLEFEDPYGDEYQSEEEIVHSEDSAEFGEEDLDDFGNLRIYETEKGELKAELTGDQAESEEKKPPKEVWKGDPRRLKKDEVLDFENAAYRVFYRTSVEWSCLSLDPVPTQEICTDFPYTVYVVSGSQAQDDVNKVYVMKWSELNRTQFDDDEPSSSDSENEDLPEGDEAVIESEEFKHDGAVNRIRAFADRNVVATWSDTGAVSIFDIGPQLTKLYENGPRVKKTVAPLGRFEYSTEGYALEWSQEGRLYAGNDHLHVYQPQEATWTEVACYAGHTGSVEDIQRSPVEASVLASCSADRTIKVWDTRTAHSDSQLTIPDAHTGDVNVISWNTLETSQIASGSDDGSFKVWDLRFANKQAAYIQWHSDSITSIGWNPKDSSELAVSSADDRLTVWDLAVEEEEEVEEGYPSQLLFIHQGQEDIKELRFHPQYAFIISTAVSGFNLLQPNITEDE